MLSKRNLIYTLIAIVVLLLVINVLLGFIKTEEPVLNTETLSKAEIENKYFKVLKNFNIEDSWIKKKKIKNGKYDSLSYQYIVKVPSEIPIPIILKDINEIFFNTPASIISSEKKINGRTELTIKSENYVKLLCEFIYDNSLARRYSKIAFLITNGDELDDDELDNLLTYPVKFGVVLPLEVDSQIKAEQIKLKKKEYFIELSDDSDDIIFELNEDVKLEKLNVHIKKIISMFNSPKIFFTNKITSGFTPSIESFIKDNFKKRNRKVIRINSYIKLKGESKEDLFSLLDFHLNKLEKGAKKVFRIEYKDFISIENELNGFLKKGNKIVYPTEIL